MGITGILFGIWGVLDIPDFDEGQKPRTWIASDVCGNAKYVAGRILIWKLLDSIDIFWYLNLSCYFLVFVAHSMKLGVLYGVDPNLKLMLRALTEVIPVVVDTAS